jgi:hypothetical protein
MHGFGGRDGRHGPGGYEDDNRIGEESPATLPDDEDASDPSAPAPVMPDESLPITARRDEAGKGATSTCRGTDNGSRDFGAAPKVRSSADEVR